MSVIAAAGMPLPKAAGQAWNRRLAPCSRMNSLTNWNRGILSEEACSKFSWVVDRRGWQVVVVAVVVALLLALALLLVLYLM